MLVLPQQVLEESARSSQNHLVGLDLIAIFTGQSDICEVIILSETPKCCVYVLFEVRKLEANF